MGSAVLFIGIKDYQSEMLFTQLFNLRVRSIRSYSIVDTYCDGVLYSVYNKNSL